MRGESFVLRCGRPVLSMQAPLFNLLSDSNDVWSCSAGAKFLVSNCPLMLGHLSAGASNAFFGYQTITKPAPGQSKGQDSGAPLDLVSAGEPEVQHDPRKLFTNAVNKSTYPILESQLSLSCLGMAGIAGLACAQQIASVTSCGGRQKVQTSEMGELYREIDAAQEQKAAALDPPPAPAVNRSRLGLTINDTFFGLSWETFR